MGLQHRDAQRVPLFFHLLLNMEIVLSVTSVHQQLLPERVVRFRTSSYAFLHRTSGKGMN
jgi:hypothetical protein